MKQVKCKSGLQGWQGKLHEVYTDFEEFQRYAETLGLHLRLGYETPIDAWQDNPTVQGSVIPSDYRILPEHQTRPVHPRKKQRICSFRSRSKKHSVRMTEEQRRDEKHGLYGGMEDVAN